MPNKRKIFNDPVYGFITVPSDLIFDIIEHPYFQRLRRVKQLGVAEFVYPGALHTRFQHALGAMHLMGLALHTLQQKGNQISEEEWEAAQIAILLHDIGHGPFSHVLEYTILRNVHHEYISALLMAELNKVFDGKLSLAINMFNNTYHRPFFHQLISSQLDMDRMDYLKRDSFFTGVAEGTIGVDRLIKMLDVVDNNLVVEEKGVLSVENFLNARRLMYWQVYLHKTSICAETILINIIQRARDLIKDGFDVFVSPAFGIFLREEVNVNNFDQHTKYLQAFTELDDYDIWLCIKIWKSHSDKILSLLCTNLLDRKLFKIRISNEPIEQSVIDEIKNQLLENQIGEENVKYFYVSNQISNKGYIAENSNINIVTKDRQIIDIADASDLPTIKALSNIVKKFYICWGKNVYLQKN